MTPVEEPIRYRITDAYPVNIGTKHSSEDSCFRHSRQRKRTTSAFVVLAKEENE